MNLKSITFSGAALAVAVVMSLGMMAQPTQAAAVAATGSVSETISANQANFIEIGPVTLTEPSAGAWTAGDTIAFNHPGVTSSAASIGGAPTCTNCTVAYGANTTTFTVTSATAGTDTVSIDKIRLNLTATAAPSTIAVNAGGTAAGTLTTSRLVMGYATTTACTGNVATRVTQSISADPNAAGAALCAFATDATGAVSTSLPVTFSVSQGVVSTGTAKTVTALTNAAGIASTNYRGSGNNVTTDTAIASNSSINAVSTLSINLTAPTGNTASKVTILAPSVQAIGATVTNTSPNYQSPTVGADVTVQVTDSAGLGVNGQVVLVTVDRGSIVANTGFSGTIATLCNGATSKSVTGTSGSNAATRGAGTNTAGVINVTVCGNQTDATGKVTITAQNISTTMANATASLAMAGRPSKIDATATGNTVSATVTDAAGNRVADSTPVRFTISSNAGALSTTCAPTTNGVASSVAALVAATGTVIVSADWNETGVAATCAAAGSQQVATSVSVPGGTGGGTGGTGGTGSGQITSGTIPQGGGFGLIVFGGGTIQQLVAATGCPTASMALWATVGGNFLTYVPGTTIGAVNADFLTTFPNGVIPAGTPFIGKCR